MTEGGSGSSAACKGEYVAGGRRMAQRRPLLDGGAVVSDVRRRLVEAQNWLGVAVAEGANRISRFGLSIEDGRGMMVQKMERIGNRRSDPRSKIRSGQLPWEKVWTAMSGFGAQFEAQLQRSKAGIPEAMLRMIWNRGAPRPLIASLSLGLPAQGGEALEAKHVFDIAMSGEQVAKRLDGVPVYTVSNSANEFVLISDLNTSKSLGIFCFREADAEALLSQVRDREPSLGRGAKVVAVSLDKVYQLSTEGIAFRFLPDPRQVKNALEARSRAGEPGKAFDGVPVFQSDNLILRSNNRRFCPIFFSKEDLETALQRAFKQQQKINPALKVSTDIQVGSFEDVLKRMEGNEEDSGWGDIVFIPPGMDAYKHLSKSQGTVVG
ncbi:protein TIC 22, chloroplastic isoform X2 [Physcomitrium patens]|uniref:Protein TIC 22, chloroplastic n=1 Tax=Physcomitrium patens TaxID=3218 RepID=A9TPR1_PHYPA|nr:protein TIC 22, chloroplastic-like isoform X2 [Physcomitrium patens]PNR52277.1 hypothetical protein PHYPA_008651 [Physcomitrium patens]|eukprot:XP_024378220.1 protein TIC 22, chloroplastic-like isoform X2 [Physcomitrella patens]